MMGGGPLVEMSVKLGLEKHEKIIVALKEYKDLLGIQHIIDM